MKVVQSGTEQAENFINNTSFAVVSQIVIPYEE